MYMDPQPFRHVEWINNRAPPRFDLAWSNIIPNWEKVIDLSTDRELISASNPLGDNELIMYLSGEYDVDPSRILLTNGCSEANFLAFMSSLKRGSKVLVEKPIYTPLLEIPRAMGCDVHTIKRRSPNYLIDMEELKEKVQKIVPDLVVLQNLGNPTGRMLPDHQLEDISALLEKRNIPLMVDEVYRDFAITFDGDDQIHATRSIVEVYEKGIVTSSVTKVYGGCGLITGWLIGPRRTINRARRLKAYSVPMVSHWGNRVALSILRNRGKVLPAEFSKIRKKLNLVSAWAKGRDDVQWSEPDGCSVGFLGYESDIPSIEACERLYNDHDVRVIPGAFFHQERGFRMSVSKPYDLIRDALVEIDTFLDSLH
ncbi:MAG: pyridoxal phosphate-dependent aminotransferase [Candidatus Thermoplasmatota archaeon]|nr:pyridoxal phosphate-dependent aminotransferase [Candidatus Thermoplasmatota archaeon]